MLETEKEQGTGHVKLKGNGAIEQVSVQELKEQASPGAPPQVKAAPEVD